MLPGNFDCWVVNSDKKWIAASELDTCTYVGRYLSYLDRHWATARLDACMTVCCICMWTVCVISGSVLLCTSTCAPPICQPQIWGVILLWLTTFSQSYLCRYIWYVHSQSVMLSPSWSAFCPSCQIKPRSLLTIQLARVLMAFEACSMRPERYRHDPLHPKRVGAAWPDK